MNRQTVTSHVYTIHSYSQAGPHKKNEDSMYVHCDERYSLLVVCDGLGGHEAGEMASKITVKHLAHSLGHEVSNNRYQALVGQSLRSADQRVFEVSTRLETPSMGTTAAVVLMRDHTLYVGWVGDSRVYLFRRDGREYYQFLKTEDHNNKTLAQKKGVKIPQGEKNSLMQAIGGGIQGVDPSTYKGFPFQQGDLIIVCSDGLTAVVSDQEIEKMIHEVPFEQLIARFVKRVEELGGVDDVSVIVMGDYTTEKFMGKS